MNNKFIEINLTQSIWDRTIEEMYKSGNPILEMTAKAIIYQMELQKNLDDIKEKANL